MIEYDSEKGAFAEYKKQFNRHRGEILEHLGDAIYRHTRYNVESGVMLIYSATPMEREVYSDLIRKTDHAYMIEKQFVLIVFDHVDSQNAVKAAQNFLYGFLNQDARREVYAAVTPMEDTDIAAADISGRLFMIVQYAIQNDRVNDVVDIGDLEL